MALITAQAHYIFGLQSRVANNICYVDEQTIIFPSGNNCVKYNIDQKWQKFIQGSEKSLGMQALAISPNHRFLAVAEKGAEKATVTVYDLQVIPSKKRKVLCVSDFAVQEFVSLAFSPDSRYLITQTGQPEWTLVYWMWDKQKVMATVRTGSSASPVTQVSFNPLDNTQICVTGNNVFRLYRFAEAALKQINFQKVEAQNFLCHAWISEDRIIAGTEGGKLYLFESADVRWEMNVRQGSSQDASRTAEHSAHDLQSIMPPRVTAVVTYSKGFACSAGAETVILFEKTEEKDFYRKTREIRIPQDQHSYDPAQSELQDITTLCVSPSEETLLASTSHSQLYSITFTSAEMGKGEQVHFEHLTHSFHSNAIMGLDICIWKPLAVTCSIDRSIRVWNYETNALELYKEFQEEAYSISLHPSGLYVLVGFADKLRLMNLLIDDIRVFREFSVRGCKECSFSNGGHLFAAVSGNVIHIFSSVNFENITSMKGHSGKIRSIIWSGDDSKLISCGMDGAVYEWNVLTSKRESECVLKTCAYTGVTISPDAKTLFAVGSDQTLKEISDSQILREFRCTDVAYTAVVMAHSGRMLFIGTATGTVQSIKYPLPVQKEYNEYQAHAAPVTKMAVTYDDQFLLTVSEDSCMLIWKIVDKEGRGVRREKEVAYAEEVLITKSDMEEKNQVMLELKTRVDELTLESEYQLRLKDMNYNEKVKELTEKFIQEMESLKNKNQVLKTEKEKEEVRHEETISDVLEKHSCEMQDLESANNQKLLLEYEKYQELQVKSHYMQEDYEKQLHEMELIKTQALEELTEFFEAKLHEKTAQLEQSQDELRQHLREFDETKKQMEEDEDCEIQEIKIKYERQLWNEKETNLQLKGETGIMRKKFSSLQKEIEEKNNDIEKLKIEQQKLQGIIRSLEKDIMGLKKEIQERDETIQDKEKCIYDLKKKNQELEKFKFVLDYEVKELKKQIEPRENEIKEMKEQIQEMEGELQNFHKQNTKLELDITDLQQKLKATKMEVHRERQKVRDVEALVNHFKTDLHNCVGFIQEPKKLKESIRKMYEKYVQQSDVVEIVGVDVNLQQEFDRQREHLERTVASLHKKLLKESEIHCRKNARLIQENGILIKEINDLRRELKISRTKINDLETMLQLNRNKKPSSSGLEASTSKQVSTFRVTRLNFEEEAERIIEMQRQEIKRLQDQIQKLEQSYSNRPPSGGRLPPLTR